MPSQVITLIAVSAVMFLVIGGLAFISHYYTLDGIKSKTVGDGQHGTARWATKQEIRQTYAHIPFEPELWRKGEHLPEKQGLILGCEGPKNHVTALVDTDDIHAMVTAASGAGKTAFFLYPNIEYALASGMSFLCTDTKGDLYRNYAGIAKDFYGYQIAVLDLRNPTRSDGNNLLHLINKYMDIYKANPNDLAAKAKAEKYSKILAKTLINTSGGDSAQYGQNAFFYDSAEGLLTAMFLLVAEYLPTEDENGNPVEKRHIVSVFKLVQELLAPSKVKGKNQFQILLEKLPPNHKARWFAGSALNTAEQAMASVISTVLSRLNAFLDSEMEQILCFDTAIDAEKFCNEKSAIFIVLPEEDQTKYFMVSLILQNLYREILTVADENGGRLKNRVVFFADELGTCPPIQSLELMFSASRSRGLMLVPIVQSITGQLMIRSELQRARAENTKANKEYESLKAEVLKAIQGKSALPQDVLSEMLEDARQKVLSSSERITELTAELNDGNSKIEEMKAEFNQIVSWSKIFDDSPMEVKKMICGYIIKKVSVCKDYDIKIEFNINVEQFLNGIDGVSECDTSELSIAQ